MRSRWESDFFELPRLRVIAHRGASGSYPENTLPAFRAAAELGALYCELDVRMTRDGEIVVSHDEDLRRVTGHEGIVSEMTLEEVKAADAGYNFSAAGHRRYPFRGQNIRVPTLSEVLVELPQQRFIIEIKQTTATIVSFILQVVKRAGMNRRVMIVSEHQEPMDEVRRLAPEIPTNLTAAEVVAFVLSLPPGAEPYEPRGAALQIPPEHLSWRLVTRESVAAAHRIGLEIHVWTINDIAEMRSLIALGVDGILTDFPDRLAQVLRTS